jgi:hypothetical protein
LVPGEDLFKMPLGKVKPQIVLRNVYPLPDPVTWWYVALWKYFERRITFQDDLLPAIAGLAEKVAERTGYHNDCGLWREDIHRGLLWQRSVSAKRSSGTSSPSWSWASMEAKGGPRHISLDQYEPGFRAEILDLNIVNIGGNCFTPVLSTSLKFKGQFRHLGYWEGSNRPIYNERSEDVNLNDRWKPNYPHPGWSLPEAGWLLCTLGEKADIGDDCRLEMVGKGVICLQVTKFSHHNYNGMEEGHATVFGLMLEPTGKQSECYRRIGIVEIPEQDGIAEG